MAQCIDLLHVLFTMRALFVNTIQHQKMGLLHHLPNFVTLPTVETVLRGNSSAPIDSMVSMGRLKVVDGEEISK
jgi:hypothetical protein